MGNIIDPTQENYPWSMNIWKAMHHLAKNGKSEFERENAADLIFCIELTCKKADILKENVPTMADFCLRMSRAVQIYGSFAIVIKKDQKSRQFYQRYETLYPIYHLYEKICCSFQEQKKLHGTSARKEGDENLGEYDD